MDNLQHQTACSAGAEAVLSLQPRSSMSINYHSLFGPHNDLMLLELDDKLLPEILNQRVTLRGRPDEDAVFCTTSKTYAVKFVGTSNSMFLIPPPSDEVFGSCNNKDDDSMVAASVLKVAPGCMEIVEIAPKLDELKVLLSQNPYSFSEASEMDTSEEREKTRLGLYKWEDLVERIQASDEELKLALQSLSAVEIDGYWRILDDSYMHSILSMLLHNVILNDWSVNALNEDEVLSVLEADGYSRNIAKLCLQAYCSKVDEGVYVSCKWKLDERRVCVHLAREILKGGKMKLEIFMEKWTRKLPDGMLANFDMLEGEFLTEKLGIETRVYSFSVSSLPSAPAERFSVLFRHRPKWEWKDLQPYIRDLKVPGLTAEAILLKYTRRTQPTAEAEPVFSAR